VARELGERWGGAIPELRVFSLVVVVPES